MKSIDDGFGIPLPPCGDDGFGIPLGDCGDKGFARAVIGMPSVESLEPLYAQMEPQLKALFGVEEGFIRKVFNDPIAFDVILEKIKSIETYLTYWFTRGTTFYGWFKIGHFEQATQKVFILDYPEAKLRPDDLQELYTVLREKVKQHVHLIVLTNDETVKEIIEAP